MRTTTALGQEASFVEAARRKQIVDCAIETIAALGYGRASLAEIAKRAGISKGNLTYYFASKDELIDEVVRAVYARAEEYMMTRLKAETTARAMLRTLIITNIAFIRDERVGVQAVTEIISNSRRKDGRPRYDVRSQDQFVADIEEVLKWGQRAGEFRRFTPGVYALAIRTAIDALSPRLLLNPKLDIDQYGKELAELFERAIVKEKKR